MPKSTGFAAAEFSLSTAEHIGGGLGNASFQDEDDPLQPCRGGTRVERHSLEPGHGDVCRDANEPGSDFYCPRACQPKATAPFCIAARSETEDSREDAPCRAAVPPRLSEYDRLSSRLEALEGTKQRLAASGLSTRKVEEQARLVKFERRRARAAELLVATEGAFGNTARFGRRGIRGAEKGHLVGY